jgi:uncharacterized membrane protein
MNKGRLEAFSDGVIAIIITIMVMELKAPTEPTWAALCELAPIFFGYVVSFLYVGIYWNNHHHLFQSVKTVDGPILWANLFLLFWLSLIPFATSWLGEQNFSNIPVAFYGIILLGSAISYYVLTNSLLRIHDRESIIHKAVGSKMKEHVSLACYVLGVALAFWSAWPAFGLFTFVAVLWLYPDKRIEREIKRQ